MTEKPMQLTVVVWIIIAINICLHTSKIEKENGNVSYIKEKLQILAQIENIFLKITQ